MTISRRIFGMWALVLFIAASSLPLSAQQSSKPGELSATIHARYFTVYYDPSDPYLANLMARVAQDELIRVSKDLGYQPDPKNPFPLRIYKSHRSFIRHEGIANKYTVGIARSGSASIALDASGSLMFPQEPLAHEITHAVIFRILGPAVRNLPLWFNEGLAQYESGKTESRGSDLIADAAAVGSLLSLAEIQSTFPEKQIDLSYAESASAVNFLIDKHGKAAPKAILRELARTGSFDEAMQKVTAQSPERFETIWYHDTTRRYWAWSLMRTVTAVLSITMSVLAVIVFVKRRKRMAKAAKEWELEELDEAIRRQQGNDWSL